MTDTIPNSSSQHQDHKFIENVVLDYTHNDLTRFFGEPVHQQQIVLNDAMSEFYNNLTGVYTESQRQAEDIPIIEKTWNRSEELHITVWYEKQANLVPKAYLIWPKGSEF